jgi:hypothetical protein
MPVDQSRMAQTQANSLQIRVTLYEVDPKHL